MKNTIIEVEGKQFAVDVVPHDRWSPTYTLKIDVEGKKSKPTHVYETTLNIGSRSDLTADLIQKELERLSQKVEGTIDSWSVIEERTARMGIPESDEQEFEQVAPQNEADRDE